MDTAVTGKDAFEYVVRRLEETTEMLAEARADLTDVRADNESYLGENHRLKQAVAEQTRRVADLTAVLVDVRKGDKPLADLYDEASHVMRQLIRSGPISHKQRHDLIAGLTIRLAAAKQFITLPF